MGKYTKMSQQVLEKVGGLSNITFVERCATRLRIHYASKSKVDVEAIKGIEDVVGVVAKTGQVQIIIGPEVNDAFNDFLEVSGWRPTDDRPTVVEEEPEKKGFMRLSTGYKAAVVMSTSKNAEDIVKYVNWMYSDVKNYNLCMYGVEGAHWVNNGDGTYSYPEGKESYLTKAPYSGIFALVENQNMSDLLYSGYTEQERGWITASRNKDLYVDNDIIDYILPRNAGMSTLHSASLNMYWNGVAASAWSGNANPSRTSNMNPNLTYAEYYRQEYLKEDKEYLDFLTQQYNLMKQLRG